MDGRRQWPIFPLDFRRSLESLAGGRRHLRVLMHPLSFRLVPMNPVFCQDGFNCQSGKVKILEMRHLAHSRVQAARRRRSTGTVFVSRRLLSRWTRWFWNTIMDQIDLSSTANAVNLYRPWQFSFRQRSLCKRIFEYFRRYWIYPRLSNLNLGCRIMNCAHYSSHLVRNAWNLW